jgi:hypothetical protein
METPFYGEMFKDRRIAIKYLPSIVDMDHLLRKIGAG